MAEQTYPVMDNAPRPAVSAPADSAALPDGHKVLEYSIEKLLGGGGFGLTYLARDINLELPVALKEYFPGDLATRSADHSVQVRYAEAGAQFAWGLERFLDEARALASFRHPSITRVLRYFRENGTAYIVMEYETGDPLKHWLARQEGLSRTTLLQLVYPLLDGLEAVHRRGFLHRDIKPDNIYIRADGSPVLLDFGSARRVSAERDMTSIVSPGFAPFEQYHRQGKQGPWTDIYSLGAVMYWMTTGHKPLESASRVKQDNMPKAVDAGHPAFGETLLRAIDWAMQPDEARRPQDVAGFRAALAGPANRTSPPGGEAKVAAAFAADTPAFAHRPSDEQPKNMLGTIMFLDLVAYSAYPEKQQAAAKTHFNELLAKALKGLPESSRIVIDSGEGAAVCFLADPEEALQSALLLRSLLLQKYRRALAIRTGLHLGPIRMVFDSNNRVGVVGDGINVAQRIMDFAKANQIVASRAYYDVVSRITDLADSQFKPLGTHLDKHMRSHDIYAVLDPQTAPPRPPASSVDAFENTASYAALASLTPELAADMEAELARLIGPLARVLVKKAMPRAVSAQGLRELLSVSIPDPRARELFVNPKSHKTQPPFDTGSRPGAGTSLSRLHANAETSAGGQSGPMSLPLSSPYFSTAQLLQLERALSQFIGPLAKMIVKKEAAKHVSLQALEQALAGHVDRPADRAKLLAAMQNIQ
ncbi:protein kinase domain-containing protein [Polaromonas sp.]|uniref:protein kinase domain-containing protein n=1 Tax=Polaromonas sp. TaxID=1869339 RepID=UPI003BAB9C2A